MTAIPDDGLRNGEEVVDVGELPPAVAQHLDLVLGGHAAPEDGTNRLDGGPVEHRGEHRGERQVLLGDVDREGALLVCSGDEGVHPAFGEELLAS